MLGEWIGGEEGGEKKGRGERKERGEGGKGGEGRGEGGEEGGGGREGERREERGERRERKREASVGSRRVLSTGRTACEGESLEPINRALHDESEKHATTKDKPG